MIIPTRPCAQPPPRAVRSTVVRVGRGPRYLRCLYPGYRVRIHQAVVAAFDAEMILVARVSGTERLSPFESAAGVEFSIEAATSPKINIAREPIGALKVTRFYCRLPAGTGR